MIKTINVRMEVHYRESCLRVKILNHVFRLACIIVRGTVAERVDNKLAGSWLVERDSVLSVVLFELSQLPREITTAHKVLCIPLLLSNWASRCFSLMEFCVILFDVHGCVRIDRVPLKLKMCGPALEIDRWRCYVLNCEC